MYVVKKRLWVYTIIIERYLFLKEGNIISSLQKRWVKKVIQVQTALPMQQMNDKESSLKAILSECVL